MYTNQQATKPAIGSWAQGFCYTAYCKERFLYVQRCDENKELWKVAFTPGEGVWLVAAPGPLCPLCGGTLLTSTPFEEELEARTSMS